MPPATATAELVDETQLATVEQQADAEAGSLLQQANALVIDCDEAADVAAEFRNEIVERRKGIEEWFREPVEAAHRAHKALTTRRAEALSRFADPERVLGDKLRAWHIEQQRRRREAEQAAERERQRLMEEDRLARAVEAEAAGDKMLAERIVEGKTPQPVPHVPVAAPPPRAVAGVSFVKKFKVASVDLAVLVRAAAERPEWVNLLLPNSVALNKLASALGEQMAVPGVVVVEDSVLRTAARR